MFFTFNYNNYNNNNTKLIEKYELSIQKLKIKHNWVRKIKSLKSKQTNELLLNYHKMWKFSNDSNKFEIFSSVFVRELINGDEFIKLNEMMKNCAMYNENKKMSKIVFCDNKT